MNKEQLLDAVGGIDEEILLESQIKNSRGSVMLRRLLLAAAIIGALTVTVIAASGLFSRSIENADLVTDETVFPFNMDAQGNIIMEGQSGLKVTMEVTVNEDAPAYLEEFYVLEMPEQWRVAGGGSSGDGYVYYSHSYAWKKGDLPGKVRLEQNVVSYYTDGIYGEKCVGTLPKLNENDGVTSQITEFAGISVLKVTIPALPRFTDDPSIDAYYCVDGETRLYWTDGDYMLMFAYPSWMSDSEAKTYMNSIEKEAYVDARPDDFGKVNPQSIAQRLPHLSIGADNGTTCANNTMGLGRFTYSDGYIYCGVPGSIYRFDTTTGQTTRMILADAYADPGELFATDNYICYLDTWNNLMALGKDGTTEEYIYQGIHSAKLYAEGMTLYSNTGIIDLQTGKVEKWPEGTIGYYVDEGYVYTIREDVMAFFRAKKGTNDFEEISLSFYPISVLSNDGAVYLSRGGLEKTWNIMRYENGEEEELPVRALEFQVVGDQIIYRCEDEDGRQIKSYDMHTGQVEVLCREGFNFSILEERYLCVLCADENGQGYGVITDWNTGKQWVLDIYNES